MPPKTAAASTTIPPPETGGRHHDHSPRRTGSVRRRRRRAPAGGRGLRGAGAWTRPRVHGSPGYNPVSATGQIASGADSSASPPAAARAGCAPAPSIKLATNTPSSSGWQATPDDLRNHRSGPRDHRAGRATDLRPDDRGGFRAPDEERAWGYGGEEFIPWSMGLPSGGGGSAGPRTP